MDEKIRMKNMFLTDKIARKAFCVGGLFYPLISFNTCTIYLTSSLFDFGGPIETLVGRSRVVLYF